MIDMLDLFNRLSARRGTQAKAAVLYAFSVVNLLYMHYYIVVSAEACDTFELVDYVSDIGGVLFDMAVLFLLAFVAAWGNVKMSLLLCYAVTLAWSFSNVFYFRFFGQYIPFSAFGLVGNLTDGLLLRCMLDRLSVSDLLYVASAVAFTKCYRHMATVAISRKTALKAVVVLPLLAFALDAAGNIPYCFVSPDRCNLTYYKFRMVKRHIRNKQNIIEPLHANFIKGSVRVMVVEAYTTLLATYELTEEDIRRIKAEALDHRMRVTDGLRDSVKWNNIVFIIVESYLSVTSDMTVDGVEVTPYLNRLKCSEGVYYNGSVRPNVTIGESGDGQLIYMTGLLPLRNAITVGTAKSKQMPGLPNMVKRRKPGIKTRMMIPTIATLWNQQEMCDVYGIDRLYSVNDYDGSNGEKLTDEEVFAMAERVENAADVPFMDIILTISMHEPYDKPIGNGGRLLSAEIPERYSNYLTACRYTDRSIGEYIEGLKRKGLYDSTIIVIAADHNAHADFMDMAGKISEDLPLYIVNGGIDNGKAWKGACEQLDVYTTLMDICGIASEWHGLGHTLVGGIYSPSAGEAAYEMSDMIIRGDFFRRVGW